MEITEKTLAFLAEGDKLPMLAGDGTVVILTVLDVVAYPDHGVIGFFGTVGGVAMGFPPMPADTTVAVLAVSE